jgi:hypothetical protein
MGSSFSADRFHERCFEYGIYGYFILYFSSTILAVIAIDIMRRRQGWHNLALTTLLVNILIYSVASFVFFFVLFRQQKSVNFLEGLELATSNFCHWIITITYIKTSLETRMLLNKDTYLKSADEMDFVRNFRCYITFANISASIIIVAISAT